MTGKHADERKKKASDYIHFFPRTTRVKITFSFSLCFLFFGRINRAAAEKKRERKTHEDLPLDGEQQSRVESERAREKICKSLKTLQFFSVRIRCSSEQVVDLMAGVAQLFDGHIKNKSKENVDLKDDKYKGKTIGLYFSAHWFVFLLVSSSFHDGLFLGVRRVAVSRRC